ncbi:MAG: hypothetical protein A3B47_04580 [Candidatus Levybacteria bacterium RIFCSPLOWO2_01_FULL_39_24]|nr:MAG: hypothetical protein A2800_03950 [Candidatus Levybacteria bacterium RIFCSPHIGHO2_01_FULL_40_16]OGH28312.1 MAG: hypothetical protein A3E12_02500 [Candidatus Levybacteria bacterium RIFCSPHIGHO2_12_FULL_39_9]OGH46720.1 MAG: hypothetical protein A3B47_04580 [Candidatus Levybacteria bacterium RIFCSPLOWO2_01_FULL_39_24]
MNRRKRPVWLLVISFLLLVGLAYLIIFHSPSAQFAIYSAGWRISILPVFFLLFFAFLLSFITYLLRSLRRAALIGLLIVIYLVFRMLHLDSPHFPILLLALFITLELFFKKHI